MLRGNFIGLSLAGCLIILLTTLSSLLPPPQMEGTVYYYNENGKLLFDSSATVSKTYVIRTQKKRDSIYTWGERFTGAGVANVKWIHEDLAEEVEYLIETKQLDHWKVKANIVEIVPVDILRKMRTIIQDNGNGGFDSINNKEYGGLLRPDGSFIMTASGKFFDLCDTSQHKRTVALRSRGVAEFHSHPSGCSGDLPVYPCTGPPEVLSWKPCMHGQGPSRVDQDSVEKRRGYVFGMRAKIIFIYDSTGILATLPFSFFMDNWNR